MRILLRAFVLVSIFILASLTVHAQEQNNITIGLRVGFSEGMGYENPSLGANVRLSRMITKDTGFTFSAGMDRARKVPGGGHSETVSGTLRHYWKDFFAGGGVIAYKQATSLYSKAAASPLAELGFIRKQMTVRVYAEPYDFLSPNHSIAGGFSLDYYQKTDRRWGYRAGFNSRVARFKCFQGANGLTDTCTGGSASVSFGVFFKTGQRRE